MSYLLMCDRQQSVLGAANTVRSYSAFGALTAIAGPSLAYCGQHRDPLKGIYHLGNGYRSFDPGLMRFLSPDALSPFGAGGVNAYAYCQGDPINYQDNSGRMGVGSFLQALYVAWKGGMIKTHKSTLVDMRKNDASVVKKLVVRSAMVLDALDITLKGAKDYFGMSLHTNTEMMMTDDPLFSYLQGADIGVSLLALTFDYVAYGLSRPYKQNHDDLERGALVVPGEGGNTSSDGHQEGVANLRQSD